MLVITPYIMDDGNILMEINPEVSDGEVILGLPSETTTTVTTTLITQDGGTIFIGGLIRDRKEDLRDQVPGLGRLPIIGALFGKTTHSTQKTEIIVIITAHIISPSDRKSFAWEEEEIEETSEKLERERSLMELIPGFEEH
jgi:type II secretory pathway component GspD/PulD (secretin)